MQPLLNIAIRAARRAGEIIVRGMNRLHRIDVQRKGQNDFVSEIDLAAERDIIETIRKHYPDHAVLAEESGQSDGRGQDPRDDPLKHGEGYTGLVRGSGGADEKAPRLD